MMDSAAELHVEADHAPEMRDYLFIVAIVFGVTWFGHTVAPILATGIANNVAVLEPVFSESTVRVLIVTTVALILSTTPISKLPNTTAIGTALVYLFVAAMGARASVSGLAEAPAFVLGAFIWIAIPWPVLPCRCMAVPCGRAQRCYRFRCEYRCGRFGAYRRRPSSPQSRTRLDPDGIAWLRIGQLSRPARCTPCTYCRGAIDDAMNREWLKLLGRRLALIGAVGVMLLASFIMWAWQQRSSIDDIALPTWPERERHSDSVTVRWLGVSTLLFDDGETQILIDGFLSRPSLGDLLLRRPIQSSAADVNRIINRFRMDRVAAIIPSHTHFDHALDSASIANRTGAVIFGSPSAGRLARGASVPEEQISIVTDTATREFGLFQITLITTPHIPFGWRGSVPFDGIVEATDYRPGARQPVAGGQEFQHRHRSPSGHDTGANKRRFLGRRTGRYRRRRYLDGYRHARRTRQGVCGVLLVEPRNIDRGNNRHPDPFRRLYAGIRQGSAAAPLYRRFSKKPRPGLLSSAPTGTRTSASTCRFSARPLSCSKRNRRKPDTPLGGSGHRQFGEIRTPRD